MIDLGFLCQGNNIADIESYSEVPGVEPMRNVIGTKYQGAPEDSPLCVHDPGHDAW